ncbi:MAG: lytic murein transglycosylase B [Brachymonas sp.]|nr:lytic murein transglycosylase B [Brachymonas sp.]
MKKNPAQAAPSFAETMSRRMLLGGLAGAGLAGLASCASRSDSSLPPAPKAEPQQVPPAPVETIALQPHELVPKDLVGSYAQRPDVMAQIPAMAQRLRLPEVYVRNAIGNADFLPSVPRLILPAGTGVRRNWRVYRSRFVEPIRIRAGVQFWQENVAALQRAERELGVAAHYIVGIIGVETIFGRNMGNMRVIDTLSTLSFDFPQKHPRAAARNQFFREELEAYLLLCAKNRDNPLALQGSYAGAMGLPQFMPSSWLKYAIDFDGDKHIDLFSSPTDAIGSVANYFRAFGWEPGLPPLYNVAFDNSRLQLSTLLAPDIVPSFPLQDFAALGAQVQSTVPNLGRNGKLALIELENGQAAPSYYAGTQNFYVITRYNNSSYYAKAVIDLAEAVREAVGM